MLVYMRLWPPLFSLAPILNEICRCAVSASVISWLEIDLRLI